MNPKIRRQDLFFYPGGKVETSAYEPLMQACAAQDILCVLVSMPFHLAVFDKMRQTEYKETVSAD